jgi:23S rRNA (adenine-N6)-dimethyltransferase
VIAIEKDPALYDELARRFAPSQNVEVQRGDFLSHALPPRPYRVVSNVPYGITSAVVRRLVRGPAAPEDAWLVLQREAAEKFAGLPSETLFSLLAKPRFTLSILRTFRRSDFVPPPSVDSVLLRIRRRETPLVAAPSRRRYERFVRATFGHGGDMHGALRPYITSRQIQRLEREAGFSRRGRPSAVRFEQWLVVFRFLEHECLGHDPTGSGVGSVLEWRQFARECPNSAQDPRRCRVAVRERIAAPRSHRGGVPAGGHLRTLPPDDRE